MTARIGSFSRNSENRMLFAIAARIGTDPGGMTGRARLSATRYGVSGYQHEIDALSFGSLDKRLRVQPRFADKHQADLRRKRLRNTTITSIPENPIEQHKHPRA